jgi:hypothetical protein
MRALLQSLRLLCSLSRYGMAHRRCSLNRAKHRAARHRPLLGLIDGTSPHLRQLITAVNSPATDRRRAPRHPVRQIGVILAHPNGAPRYCLILDKSDGGARVRTTSDFDAPNEFFLRLAETESKYRVVWRNGSVLGVMRVN